MEIKLFGKSLFSVGKSKGQFLVSQAQEGARESKYLYDFYKGRGGNNSMSGEIFRLTDYAVDTTAIKKVKTEPEKPKEQKEKITPKGAYELKLLNNLSFKLNTDPAYVTQQIADFTDKLGLLKSEEYDMRRGVEEVSSVLTRMENRKKYPEFCSFFEQYPYTTTSRVTDLISKHDHLQLGEIAQFVADMPKEAVTVMKDYNKQTDALCKKMTVFYIVADKKDFKKTDTRRDPILLAQSPFGHFWQILGAWDKEMLLVEEL